MLNKRPDLTNIFQKKNWLKIAIAFFILFLIGGIFLFSYGNNSPISEHEAGQGQALEKNGMLDLFLKLILSMALIVGLIYVTIYVIRHIYRKRNSASKSQVDAKGPVKILSVTSLSANKNIYLVKVLNEILVLGVTDQQINLISKVKPGEWEEYGIGEETIQENNSFADIFTKFIKGRKK